MTSYQVNILEPKAAKLLRQLEELNLISLSENPEDPFLTIVERLRKKAASNPPSLDEITKEVEAVRSKRYAGNKE